MQDALYGWISRVNCQELIALAKTVRSTTNEVIISSIIPCGDQLADKESKVNNIVKNFSKEDEKIKFIREKSLDARKHAKKDDMHLINIDITPIVKNTDFLNNG